MIESCSSERLSCSFIRPGVHALAALLKCGRDAQWRVDGSPLCWQHAQPLLAGNDAGVAAALDAEGERREADRLHRITNGRAGLIYVLQPYGVTPAPLKIGFTRDFESLAERLIAVQIGSWHTLEIVGLRSATITAEQDLHRRLRAHWIRGEWFQPHHDVWVAIHATGSPFEVPDDQAADRRGVSEMEAHVSASP